MEKYEKVLLSEFISNHEQSFTTFMLENGVPENRLTVIKKDLETFNIIKLPEPNSALDFSFAVPVYPAADIKELLSSRGIKFE